MSGDYPKNTQGHRCYAATGLSCYRFERNFFETGFNQLRHKACVV